MNMSFKNDLEIEEIVSVRVRMIYPDQIVKMPVIGQLARDFDVLANIRRAAIDGGEGWIVCELQGEQNNISASLKWLAEVGVQVELLGDVVES